MEDIITRLKEGVKDTGVLISSAAEVNAVMSIAATEIVSLREQLVATQAHAARLREELNKQSDKTYKLAIVEANGAVSVYLNDYRIAGGKPFGGGQVLHNFNCRMKDIYAAIDAAMSSDRT